MCQYFPHARILLVKSRILGFGIRNLALKIRIPNLQEIWNSVPGIWNPLNWNPESGTWNPESTELESGIRYLDSGIHRVESRIHDCLEISNMGQTIFSLYSKIVLRRAQPQFKT